MSAYCTVEEVYTLGLRQAALVRVEPSLLGQIEAQSSIMDGFLPTAVKLPLSEWPESWRECCAVLTAYEASATGGLSPSAPGDAELRARADQRRLWLADVRSGGVSLPGLVDATAAEGNGAGRFMVRLGFQRGLASWG